MKIFCLSNYKHGSIVNLMSSIGRAFQYKSKYAPLKSLKSEVIRKARNVVLLIIDGLGYNYLMKKGKNTIFYNNLVGPITSVFLPTTAAAISTFLTGVPSQQHAHTAWFMNLKETGTVTKVLPFTPRIGGPVLSEQGVEISDIIDEPAFSSKIKVKNFSINPKSLSNSDFTSLMSKKSTQLSFKDNDLKDFFGKIKKAIKSSYRKKYIYAYWPGFDACAHETGVNSKKTEKHLKKLNKTMKKFIKEIKNTNTLLLITSDHGFVDTPKNKLVRVKNHPIFQECLTIPLCGEGRTPFCYVHPSKAKKFENYVKNKMKKYCYIFKSEELIRKNYFGLFKPHKKLFDRLGDYILICKENYIIKDYIKKDKKERNIGHHGGISQDEMLVPLIVINL